MSDEQHIMLTYGSNIVVLNGVVTSCHHVEAKLLLARGTLFCAVADAASYTAQAWLSNHWFARPFCNSGNSCNAPPGHTGMFQWVVDTFPEGNPNSNAGTNTGTPPTNRYELEPNSVQFMFTKEVNTYGYTEAAMDRRESMMEAEGRAK